MSLESRILKLNNYLPPHIRTNDINQLLEVVTLILSSSSIISSVIGYENNQEAINDPSTDKLAIEYEDINSEILKYMHPYYASSYCKVNTTISKFCESNVYTLLSQWCFPEYSIKDLRKFIPKLTFSDLVHLSLVCNPIPNVSNKYWDTITLFYYACKNQYPNPEAYLNIFWSEDLDEYILGPFSNQIIWILYKFGYTELLDKLSVYFYYAGLVSKLWKVEHNIQVDDISKSRLIIHIQHGLTNIAGTILSYEKIIDLIVYASIIYNESSYNKLYKYLLKGVDNDIYNKFLNRKLFGLIDINRMFLMYIAQKVGKSKVKEIIDKYISHFSIRVNYVIEIDYDMYDFSNVNNNNYKIIYKHILRDNSEIAEKEFNNNTRFVFDLTSGNLIDYINNVKKSDRSKLNLNTIFQYAGINQFGGVTFNNRIINDKSQFRKLKSGRYELIYDLLEID